MNENPPGLEKTTIQLDGETLTITRQDARLLSAALIQQLEESDREIQEILKLQVKHLEGWIDYDGYVRIGRWLLDITQGQLAFVFRPPHNPVIGAVQYVAPLRKTLEGWVVDPINVIRLIPRR